MEDIVHYACSTILTTCVEIAGSHPCPTDDCPFAEQTLDDCTLCWTNYVKEMYDHTKETIKNLST